MSIYTHKVLTVAEVIKRFVPKPNNETTREFTFDRLGLIEMLLADEVTQETSSSPHTK